MENNELDALLDVKEGESTLSDASSGEQPTEMQKQIGHVVAKERSKWQSRIDEIKKEKDELAERLAKVEQTVKPLEPRPIQEPEPQLGSVDDWTGFIKREAVAAQKQTLSEVEKIKEANWNVELNKLAKSHGIDLNTSQGKQQIEEIRGLALKIGIKNEFDPYQISDGLSSAYAAKNHQQLLERAQAAEQFKMESEILTNDLGVSSSIGSERQNNVEAPATRSDMNAYRSYKEAGGEMTLQDFLKEAR